MFVFVILARKYIVASSRAAPWWVMLSMRRRRCPIYDGTDRRTDARPLRYASIRLDAASVIKYKQGVDLTARNTTGPPCSVTVKWTYNKTGGGMTSSPGLRGWAACKATVESYRRQQTTTTNDDRCHRALYVGGPVISSYETESYGLTTDALSWALHYGCNMRFPRPTRVLNENGISIASEFFARLTRWRTDRQTDRPRCSVVHNRRHLPKY